MRRAPLRVTPYAPPVRRSASVLVAVALEYWPTAVQALAETHDTPSSSLLEAPVGFGVVSIDHLVPFQRCAIVTLVEPL